MKKITNFAFIRSMIVFILFVGFAANTFASAPLNTPLRRPLSPESPMWVIHIDTWIWPDPQKAIDLIPEDIKPYVVFNISLSVSSFVRDKYPFTIAESWLRTCAENRVWATIQPASGFYCNFSYTELDDYEYFYKYPNFLGWNFAEQNWGFETMQDFYKRLDLFIGLLKLADKYGGFLMVSNFMPLGNQTNALGKLKLHPEYAAACKKYKNNHIVFDKYTFTNGFYDNESSNLGTFLAGYAGHYGVRFDECGWESRTSNFPESTGAVSVIEHFMMTGATVTDGPELTWLQTLRSNGTVATTNGYTMKRFGTFPQFNNISVDNFRKVLDGSVPILTKEEVIQRTKYIFVNDVNSSNNKETYNSEPSLYTGLYAMDGELENNKTWYKKTGRYPAIPMTYREAEDETGAFETVILKSKYAQRWPTIQQKQNELNQLFPEEYTGDVYAGRVDNNWLIYNPYMDEDKTSTGSIPFQYNSSDRMEISLSRFAMAVVNEHSNNLQIYLTNYDTQDSHQRAPLTYGIRRNTIAIHGCTTQPTFTFSNRSTHNSGTVSSKWENNVFTLTIDHNGPMDISINCAGNASNRKVVPVRKAKIAPAPAPIYTGPRQYEAENFDYKSIRSVSETAVPNYTAMGYLSLGTNAAAAMRDTISVERTGMYKIITKYAVFTNNMQLDMYINAEKVATPLFTTTSTTQYWGYNTQIVKLQKGKNIFELRAKATTSNNMFFDNIVVEEADTRDIYHFEHDNASTTAATPAAELITVLSGSAGVVEKNIDNKNNKVFKTYSAGNKNKTGIAALDMFNQQAQNYAVVWKQYFDNAASKNGIMLRTNGDRTNTGYAEGMRKGYVFVVNANNNIELESYVANGGENLDKKAAFASGIQIVPNKAYWFRASAINNVLSFECSSDSINWVGATETTFTDNTFVTGGTDLVWGMGVDNNNWTIDNISYIIKKIDVSKFDIKGLNYAVNNGPSVVDSFNISGYSPMSEIKVNVSGDFEIATASNGTFGSTINIVSTQGTVAKQTIYVRLKAGLEINNYSGNVNVTSNNVQLHTLALAGTVTPEPLQTVYNFETDIARPRATNPPALNITVGKDNTATAGVVAYTDITNNTSNMLRLYSGGQRNGTGVLDLNLFPTDATDYTVTWKQCIETAGPKVGVLLRGDKSKVGSSSTGYVQGLMHGYLFIVFNTSNNTEFRIYRSDQTFNALTMLTISTAGGLKPDAKKPMWYRASVSGDNNVTLRLEYSTDNINWTLGTATSDNGVNVFSKGATQFVWGLAASNNDFYVDDIAFYGLTTDVENINIGDKEIVSRKYFTITGQHIDNIEQQQGVFIQRTLYSDGSISNRKVLINKKRE